MVGMGGSSKSGTSDEPIDTKFIPVFGGAMLGIGALLFGLSGLIILLPEPQYSAPKHKFEMLTPDEAAKAAHERLAKDGSWSTDKYGNTIYIAHKPLDRNKVMPKLEMLSSIEASKAARARLARSGAESFAAEKELKAFNVLPGIWICNECGAHYGRKEEAENCFDGVCPKAKQFTGGRQGESVYQSFMRKHGHSMRRQGYDAESFSADESNAYQVITTDWKSSMEPKDRYNNDKWFITGDISFATPDSSGNYGRGVETISLISTFGEGLTKETAKEDAINRATLYLYHDVIGYKNAESVVKEYNPEKMIPIGTKVRSYDFWPHDKPCYKEGVIVDHAPSPSCSPGCMHYHIRTTKVVRRGKSRPVEEGEIFMTHPYADPWDQEYPGQLAPHIQVISTAFPSTSTI